MSERCPRCHSEYCCGVDYAQEIDQLTSERDRLRHQNAELLGQLDAIEFAHNVRLAERDRLREALKDISIEGHHARSGGTAYRMAVIARAALQEEMGETNDD